MTQPDKPVIGECREAFERFINQHWYSVNALKPSSFSNRRYESTDIENMWRGFRAAWNTRPSAKPPTQEVVATEQVGGRTEWNNQAEFELSLFLLNNFQIAVEPVHLRDICQVIKAGSPSPTTQPPRHDDAGVDEDAITRILHSELMQAVFCDQYDVDGGAQDLFEAIRPYLRSTPLQEVPEDEAAEVMISAIGAAFGRLGFVGIFSDDMHKVGIAGIRALKAAGLDIVRRGK